MLEVGRSRRSQPPPPHIVFEALVAPDREASRPNLIIWSSLWTTRLDARVRFDLSSDGRQGTDLRWTLLVDEPRPAPALLGHLRKRLKQLINANLRYTFGQ